MKNRLMLPKVAGALLACALATACAGERPQSTYTPGLESGITSSNGGGMRQLGGILDTGVATSARGRALPDTGNMAYPTPQPQGNVATTRVR